MKKHFLVLSALVGLALSSLLTGCATNGPALDPNGLVVLKPAVQFATQEVLRQNPEYTPAARLLGNVVCATAGTTNLSPEALNAVLVQADPKLFDNPLTSLLGNTVLSLYTIQYGQWVNAKVASTVYLQASLKVLCDGITAGLPVSVNSVPAKAVAPAAPVGWTKGYRPGK